MDALRLMTRRNVVRGIAATAAALGVARDRRARKAPPRVVVIGGGFAGATCARALKRIDPRIAVTLVEANRDLHRLPVQQRRDRRPARPRGAAVRLRRDRRRRRRRRRAGGRRRSIRRRARSRSPTARRSPTTGWCWRPASTSAGTRCPATTRRPPRRCRTPGRPASRRCCCAASSKPWTTAAWS